MCFVNPTFSPRNQLIFILNKADEAWKALSPLSKGEPRGRSERFISWMAPSDGWIKLHVNGASHGNPGSAGEGELLRGPYRNGVHGFSGNFGICTSIKVELLGLLNRLKLAFELGVRMLRAQINS